MNEPKTMAGSQGIMGRRMLVVEDSLPQRDFAVGLVRDMGASAVFAAADGVEALAVLEREPGIELVFCDLEMPHMDGMALIGEMAARSFNPRLVILSSHEEVVLESVRVMAVSYGMPFAGIITKPLSREKIVQVMASTPFRGDAGAHARTVPSFTDLEIRRGLKNNEFECFFQPQLAMQGAGLSGAEALARWRHPELGVLGPGSFLPQIEKQPEIMARFTLRILEGVAGNGMNGMRPACPWKCR